MNSHSHAPCAACKFLRRKCTQECVFAPYFPSHQPQKFAFVHKVYGASNVTKLLNDLSPAQREDAVNSLAYEAEARMRDPVYGCVSFISVLQTKLREVQSELLDAKKELATYIGPQAMLPILQPQSGYGPQQQQNLQYGPHHPIGHDHVSSYYNMMAGTGTSTGTNRMQGGALVIREPHQAHPNQLLQQQVSLQQQEQQQQQQMLQAAAQQFSGGVVIRDQSQEMFLNYEQNKPQQQQDEVLMMFNNGSSALVINPMGGSISDNSTASGFNQLAMNANNNNTSNNNLGGPLSPSLALAEYDQNPSNYQQVLLDNHHHHHHHSIHHQLQEHLLHHDHESAQAHHREHQILLEQQGEDDKIVHP